jgi:hypothetical protein
METIEVILINGSPFLHEILKKAINKQAALTVVAEADNVEKLPQVAAGISADWAYLLLSPGDEIPGVVEDFTAEHPETRLLIMATDGSKVRVRWMGQDNQGLVIDDLDGIFSVLQNKGLDVDNANPLS